MWYMNLFAHVYVAKTLRDSGLKIRWCSDLRKVIKHLSDVDIYFGIQERKDYLLGSLFFSLVGKHYMYNFRCKCDKSFFGKRLN